jgi:hypothetical protein
MAFQFTSTNRVLELGVILRVLTGWQFTRVRRRPIMVVLLVLFL